MNWMDLTLNEFQTHLASDHATPGGGTAAAIALGQAAALTEMVAGLTLGKEKWQSGWGAAETARIVAGRIMVRSGELANEDSEAFDSVVAGFKMPKSSEEEKDARRQSIRLATLRAAEVPLATSQHGMDLLNVLADLATHGNANAASDVGVASLLASAAVKGAMFNVDINVASLPAEMSQPVIEQCSGMREECSRVSRLVMHAVHDRINY